MPEIQGEVLLYEYDFSISLGDIAQLSVCKGGNCQHLTQEELEVVLNENGLDLSQPYQVVNDTHRGVTNKVFTTDRFVGFIRRDAAWKAQCGESLDIVINDLRRKEKYRGSDDMVNFNRG